MTKAPEQGGAQQLTLIACLAVCTLGPLSGITQTAMPPVLPKIAEHFSAIANAGLLARAMMTGLSVAMVFGALASGFLTGKYRKPEDITGARSDFVSSYLNDFGLGVLTALDQVAAETGATHGQIALAWLAAQPGITAPIASATSVAQAEQLIGAMNLTLNAAQLAALDKASTPPG